VSGTHHRSRVVLVSAVVDLEQEFVGRLHEDVGAVRVCAAGEFDSAVRMMTSRSVAMWSGTAASIGPWKSMLEAWPVPSPYWAATSAEPDHEQVCVRAGGDDFVRIRTKQLDDGGGPVAQQGDRRLRGGEHGVRILLRRDRFVRQWIRLGV
jgi:hypothetical protein